MRILTLLLLTMVGTTGQVWALDAPEPVQFGTIVYTGTAANDGGTLKFYGNAKDAGLGQYAIAPNGDGPTDLSEIQIWNGVDVDNLGTGFFIMATPTVGHRLPQPAADGTVSFIRAEVVTSAQQAPSRRNAPDPTIEVGQTLPVKFYGYYFGEGGSSDPATEYYGLYYVVMPADVNLSVSITATFPEVATNATAIDYVDVDGSTKSKAAGTVYVLDGSEARLGYGSFNYQTEHETWYVCNKDLTYTNGLEFYGKVHLILADGKTMTYDGTKTFISGYGVLDIYGQGGTTEGAINAKTTATSCIYVVGDVTINGGNVSAESTHETTSSCYGIQVEGTLTINGGTVSGKSNYMGIIGDITINGGTVSAVGVEYGIGSWGDFTFTGGQIEAMGGTDEGNAGIASNRGDIILGWTNPDDYIQANSYHCNTEGKAVKTVSGQRFVALNLADESDISASAIVSGTVDDVTPLAGKTLRPLDGNYVSVNAGNFTFDGSTNTTTSPFTITTGTGQNETTTHYYIYESNDPVTLSYTGSGIVQVTGTTLGAVANEPMQRSFTMPATDVALSVDVAQDVYPSDDKLTYNGSAQTPEVRINIPGNTITLTLNTDYTVTSVTAQEGSQTTDGNAVNAGNYTIAIAGLGQYIGTYSLTRDFTIEKADRYQSAEIPDITKYVPSDKSGSFTIALPALPDGATYSFTKTDASGVINTLPESSTENTLTFTTNSGKAAGTTAMITVEAKDAPNYNDYSFTVNVTVSEYTTAYEWPGQTNIYLIGNDWAFCDRDHVERPYHDNELVWAESGVTLNTSKITISGGTPSNVTYKVGETTLTAGENKLVLAPGVHRISITGDDGKLDDWVEFKVIKLVEDENLVVTVTGGVGRFVAPEQAEEDGLRVAKDGLIAECNPDIHVTYNDEDVTKSENMTLWYRTSDFNYDDEELYLNDTYRTPVHGMVGFQTTNIVGNEPNSEMCVYNVNLSAPPSASLDGVSRLDAVCGQLVWHREGEEIKKKVDLDDVPVSSGVDGGYVYYVGIDCPDFYLKDGKVYYKDESGEHLEEANKTYTDGKDIFYAGGETIYQYGNFICFGSCMFDLNDTNPVALCESHKTVGDIIGDCQCPKDGDGNCTCTSCFSQSQDGNTLTVCGETIEMGPYIVVGTNFVLTGNRAIYNIVPGTGSYKIEGANISTTINGSTITIDGKYTINVGNRPIVKGNFWLGPTETIGFYASAYARYQTEDPYCYLIDRCDFKQEIRRSEVSISDLKSEYNVGEDVEFKIATCSYKYPEDKDTYRGSTGDIKVYLNNEYKHVIYNLSRSYNVDLGELPAGTYLVRVELDKDEGYRGATTTATFTVVRNDSEVTLTGKRNTTGDEFETGANIEYDPDNPIVVNAVNDKEVSGTYWKWQISNTSDAGAVEIDHTVNESEENKLNSEDIYLNTVGLGTVTLKAGFSGNEIYYPAKEAITITVVPKIVTNPIIELVSQAPIYYDGQAKEPAVKVYYAVGKEIPADQYDVTYDNNTDASSNAKIIVKSKTGALYTISNAEMEFEIQKAVVTVEEPPTASAIAYGWTLDASTLTGGKAKAGELDVEGTFAWKDETVVPTLADSEATEYDVTFTPDNANYATATCKVKLKVVQPVTLFAENSTNLWATFCDSYERTLPEGCTAYTISSVSGTTVTLSTALTTTIPAYTPVLVYRETAGADAVEAAFKAEVTVPTDGYDNTTGIASTAATGFTYYGNAGDDAIAAADLDGYVFAFGNAEGKQSYILFSGDFIVVDNTTTGIAAHRCWLNVTAEATGSARQLSIERSLTPVPSPTREGGSQGWWYSLDGRKFNAKPMKKGLYIHNGVKVVVR